MFTSEKGTRETKIKEHNMGKHINMNTETHATSEKQLAWYIKVFFTKVYPKLSSSIEIFQCTFIATIK